MEKDWGRRFEFVTLDEATLNALLHPVFPGRHIVAAEPLTTGRCNTNYKIHLSGLAEAYVLRLYMRDQAACQKDWDIFHLVSNRVPTPAMLYAHPGSCETDASERIPTYAVMQWVDGVLLSDVLATRSITDIAACAYVVGTTLAALSSYKFPHQGFFGPGLVVAQPFDDVTYFYIGAIEQFLFAGHAAQHLGLALAERVWQFVKRNVGYVSDSEDAASLVHSDFKGVNILVRQTGNDWQVAAVLDWEFAFAGSPFVDIGNMLRYEHLLPPEFETAFIRGFQDGGGYLPPAWKKRAKLMDLLSLCEFLSRPDPRKALVEEVTELIIRTLEY